MPTSRPWRPKALALASLVALAGHAVLGAQGAFAGRLALAAAAIVIAIGAVCVRRARAITTMCASLSCAMLLPIPWQAVMALALGLALASCALAGRPIVLPTRGRAPILPTLLVGGITPLALGGWVMLLRPDLSDVVRDYVPDVPLVALLLGAAAFALVNAILEELIWRGVIQGELETLFGPVLTISVQAASFGLQHAHGVPSGAVGVALAGAWAVMLGLLRRHARGLRAPVVAHVVADASIAVIVLSGAE